MSGDQSCPAGRRSQWWSGATVVGFVALTAGGVSAWYGMGTRIALLEQQVIQQRGTDDRLNGRIDLLTKTMDEHHALPGHPVAMHIEEELGRRMTVLERVLDDLRREMENRLVEGRHGNGR